MILREEIKKAKINRNVTVVLLLFAAAIAMIAVLIVWKGQITGFSALQTFDAEVLVTGSSPDQSLSFEMIPNFIARTGEEVRFEVEPNRNGVIFSDNSRFFEITQEGVVEFTPAEENIGRHNIWIIINDNEGRYYYQNVIIIIEE
ncbi:hypothetical protein KY359_00965 [Candidatus Woesearchaeota archaeon]|nr:hypothetical protein [Candidatus Woesearchaeota archaeon]